MKQMENEKKTKGDKRMEDEKQAARKRRDKRYNDYVKQVTPKHNFLLNMLKAFVSGGFICVIGQMFSDWYGSMGLMKDEVSGYTTLSLILISVILTCLNWVGLITKFAGAGYLVPIRWQHVHWNLKLKEKFLVWAARYLPLQAR